MADAQATFVATLDSSGIQSGARSGLSALEKLGQQIQKRSKDLAAMKTAQQRLVQSAGVQEYLKRQKAIERNEAIEKKATERAVSAAAKREASEKLATLRQIQAQSSVGVDPEEIKKIEDAAKALNVTAEDAGKLAQEAMKAEASLAGVKAELEGLRSAQDDLAKNNKAVSQFKDQDKAIKSTEIELADLQAQYSAAGGSATDLADEIKEPKTGIMKLAEEAKKAGGPVGAFGGILETVGSLKTAGPLALVAVLVVLAAAAIKAGIALAKFVLISADAARNAARARTNAAMGSNVGAKDIESTMAALRDKTAASKEETQALASELYRLGDRGKRLEETALTIERFGQLGDDAKQSIKGLYEELRKPAAAVGVEGGIAKSMVITPDMLPRDVFLKLANKLGQDARAKLGQGFTANKDDIRTALNQIGEQDFADSALEQMRSLDKLTERLHENISSLFKGVGIGVLLGALQKIVALLDEGSETGKAIRVVLSELGQIAADAIEAALPYIEAFIGGLLIGAIYIAVAVLKVKNALGSIIPDSFTKNIDWIQVVLYGTIGIVLALAVAFTVLAAVGFVLALPFITIVGIIALIIIGLVMLADAVVGAFDKIDKTIEEMSWGEIGTAIIDGIIGGLKDGAARLYAAFKDLALGGNDSFKTAIKSKSPSVLFRMAGRTIPEGVALGVEDETPQVENAVASMANPADMVAPNGGRRSNGSGTVINVGEGAIVIQGASDPQGTLDALRTGIKMLLAEAALEGGLSPEPETA